MDIKTQCLIIILLEVIELAKAINPYCHLQTCRNGSHTLCRFPLHGQSLQCGAIWRFNLTQSEKNRIVYLHNYLRQYVYLGNELRGLAGPMPRSTNTSLLEWDIELENAAQRWADQCTLAHDKCRHVRRYLVGQSVGYELTVGDVEELTVDMIIQKWYDEVERFHHYAIFNFNRRFVETNAAENFSQMMWARTKRIGCGSLRYFNGIYSTLLLVCNYAPRGNNDGESVYPILWYNQGKPIRV